MKYFQFTVFLVPLLLFGNGISAQTNSDSLATKHIYVEGNFGLWSQASINYEHPIFSNKNIKLFGRLGVGISSYVFDGDMGPGVLTGFTMLTGNKNSHFEVSTGVFTFYNVTSYLNPGLYVHPVVNVGYRYQKPEGGFIFKSYLGNVGIGLGLGKAF